MQSPLGAIVGLDWVEVLAASTRNMLAGESKQRWLSECSHSSQALVEVHRGVDDVHRQTQAEKTLQYGVP